jgi:2-keto-4-pentenoate hydratase/2-oxohepta-3-ene-1,7-dioic acid hydratase in catechol pathway
MDKIICVGKNYFDHAKELGDAIPEMPVLFLKPPSTLKRVAQGAQIELAIEPARGSLHHECEIVFEVARGGYKMSLAEAQAALGRATLGLDMTLRDVQSVLKKNGHPWEIGKTFPGAAVIGPWLEQPPLGEKFRFSLAGETKQEGLAEQMRLSPAECLAYASQHFEICAGDLLFTGTPAGVGAVKAGQVGELAWGKPLRYSVKWS